MRDRIPNPIRRLRSAQFIQHQHLGLEYRPQHIQLRLPYRSVIAVLHLLQQVSIVIKQPRRPALRHQGLQNPHRQMRLANPNRSRNQQPRPCRLQRITLDKLLGPKMRRSERAMGGGKVCLIALQRTMFIPPRNLRPPPSSEPSAEPPGKRSPGQTALPSCCSTRSPDPPQIEQMSSIVAIQYRSLRVIQNKILKIPSKIACQALKPHKSNKNKPDRHCVGVLPNPLELKLEIRKGPQQWKPFFNQLTLLFGRIYL